MRRMNWRIAAIFVIGIGVSILSIFWILRVVNISDLKDAMSSASPISFLLLVVVYLTTFPIRAVRWNRIVDPDSKVSFMILMKSLIVGFAGNNLLPARAGELLRMQYFSLATKYGRTRALTTIFLEKILDVLVLGTILTICFFEIKRSQILPGILDTLFPVILIGLSCLILVVIGLRILRARVLRWKLNNNKIWLFVREKLVVVIDALEVVDFSANTLIIILLSIFVWVVEGAVFYLGLSTFGVESNLLLISFTSLCLVNFGILIPSSPGYIGVFQAAFLSSGFIFSLEKSEVLAASLLVHLSQFIPITLLGLIVGYDLILNVWKKPSNGESDVKEG